MSLQFVANDKLESRCFETMTRLYSTQRRDVHVPAEGELEILFSIFLTNWTERIGPLISLDNPQFKVQEKHSR